MIVREDVGVVSSGAAALLLSRDVGCQADVLRQGMWRPCFEANTAAELVAVALQANHLATVSSICHQVALWLHIPGCDFTSRDVLEAVVRTAVLLERSIAQQLSSYVAAANRCDPTGVSAQVIVAADDAST